MSGTGQQRWLAVIGIGEDGVEGLSAYLEKRKPVWKNK